MNISGTRVTGNEVEPNSIVTNASGGGIQTASGGSTVVLTDTTVAGNSAVEGNVASTGLTGAGLSNGQNMILIRSTVSGNFFGAEGTGDGGPHFASAIFNGAINTQLTLVNSTVSANTSTDPGSPTIGGLQAGETANIIHSTVAGNTHDPLTGSIRFGGAGTTATVRGSVLGDGVNCGPGTISGGYNVDSGASCPLGTGDVSNAAPLLGALGANGGPTATMALLANGPAINRVPLAECKDHLGAALTTDQRGFARPVPAGGSCDSGAFEFVPGPSATPAVKKKKCKKKRKKKRAGVAKKKKKCKKKKKRG